MRVLRLEELFDAVQTLAVAQRPRGDRLAVLTNGGGAGVLATDALIDLGGRLADLAPETIGRLDQALPATWPRANPVDIIGDAPAQRYAEALDVIMQDKGVDGVVVLNCPTAVTSPKGAAQAVAEVIAKRKQPPVLTSWLGDRAALQARQLFAERGIPTYDMPEDAVGAFMQMVAYRRNQEILMQTPASLIEELEPDTPAAQAIIARALAAGRSWLTEVEGKEILMAYGVPVTPTRLAGSPQEAAALAAEIDGPVALKIVSPDILQKSDIGGVALDLVGPAHVEEAAAAMLERIGGAAPEAQLTGVSVDSTIRRPRRVRADRRSDHRSAVRPDAAVRTRRHRG